MIPSTSSLTVALQTVAIGVILYFWMRRKSKPNDQAKPLHVNYGESVSFPFPMKVIGALPEWIRIPLMVKGAKPSPPRDSIDVLGQDCNIDIYEKKEVLPGKMWSIQYSFLMSPELKKAMGSLFGSNDAEAISNAPDHLKKTLESDIVAAEKYEAMSEKEKAELGGDSKHSMFIAKINIDGDDSALLIYNPVRLHTQMMDWINTLGEVKFIVSGSSSHTNFLPLAAIQFPNAKIICASAADAKCQSVGMRPADFLYDVVQDDVPERCSGRGTYEDAVEALQGQVRLFHIRGDVCTQAILVLVHKHMFIAKINIDGDDSALLIYNPVRLHTQMMDWINTLGEVKFIVSGSSSHTNFLPLAAIQFPNAKIICASAADAKCQSVGMRPADFLYDVVQDDVPERCSGRGTYEDAVEALQGQVRLFHIRGDVCTQALLVLVHKHLLEVDLLYVPSDEKMKEKEFDTGASLEHSNHRIFHFSLITKKAYPIGYLIPKYRCLMLDPTNLLSSKLMIDAPKEDGSSCNDMAESLRSALKEVSQAGVCDQVLSVHSLEMSLECFCQRMNETWGWLDGESLLG